MKASLGSPACAWLLRPTAYARGRTRHALGMFVALLAILGGARMAHAAGIEDTVAGGVALGRAANYGRANDFMAIVQNPANLALIPGADLGGELRFPIFRACFDRAYNQALTGKYKTPSGNYQGDEYFGNVCNTGPMIPTGNFGWVQSFDSGWGFGVGFFTPAGVGAVDYGKDTIVTINPLPDEQLPTTKEGLEYPTRQMLVKRRQIAGWLTAGVGYEPVRWLRFGASFGAGFAFIRNVNVISLTGGTFRDQEILSDVKAADWFVPRATGSLVLAPVDSFELFGVLTYQGDVNAKGHADSTANGIRGAPLEDCRNDPPGPHCSVDNVTLNAPFPTLEATFGFRYASRRGSRERVLNPMKDERWDFSVEGFWAQTSHVKQYTVTVFDEGDPNAPRIQFSSDPSAAALIVPQKFVVPHNWKDTFGVRAGGDINIIPEMFSMRLGVSYATNAVPKGYMNIDAFPVQKIGLHAGLTLQHGRQRLTIAYAHLFYKDTTVAVGDGKVTELVSQAPTLALPVNEGYYQATMDVVSLQTNITF